MKICPECGKEHNYKYVRGLCGVCYQRIAYRSDARYRDKTKARSAKSRGARLLQVAAYERKRRLLRRGLTVEQYDKLLLDQGGVCKICGRPPKKLRLSVDHNHQTGAIRGLLCWKCNTGIGWFREDVNALRKAADYLKGGESAS